MCISKTIQNSELDCCSQCRVNAVVTGCGMISSDGRTVLDVECKMVGLCRAMTGIDGRVWVCVSVFWCIGSGGSCSVGRALAPKRS